MVLYLSVIIVSIFLITALNAIFYLGLESFFAILLIVFIFTIVEILIDSICAFIVRRLLPAKLFSFEKLKFCAGKKEVRFYEKINIRKWKDKTLELGWLTGFRKNKMCKSKTTEYLERFIIESNYGVAVHVLCVVFGCFVIFICPKSIRLSIGLPITFVNIVLNLMSLFILRYNLPKLHKVYNFNIKKNSRL